MHERAETCATRPAGAIGVGRLDWDVGLVHSFGSSLRGGLDAHRGRRGLTSDALALALPRRVGVDPGVRALTAHVGLEQPLLPTTAPASQTTSLRQRRAPANVASAVSAISFKRA